jgi:hypothetical protein
MVEMKRELESDYSNRRQVPTIADECCFQLPPEEEHHFYQDKFAPTGLGIEKENCFQIFSYSKMLPSRGSPQVAGANVSRMSEESKCFW